MVQMVCHKSVVGGITSKARVKKKKILVLYWTEIITAAN